jgi:hypothetical protein
LRHKLLNWNRGMQMKNVIAFGIVATISLSASSASAQSMIPDINISAPRIGPDHYRPNGMTINPEDIISSGGISLGRQHRAPIRPPSLVNSPSDNKDSSPTGCLPVIYGTGEKVVHESDFIDASQSAFSQNRIYRSSPSERPASITIVPEPSD